MADDQPTHETLITLASDIVAAHVSNNHVEPDKLPSLIEQVFGALAGLAGGGSAAAAPPEPAVSIRASVKPDSITCLDCGKPMKMLKKHLKAEHGLSTDDYRERWNLKPDYPLVAPNYAKKRRELAKKIGLGRKPGQKVGRKKKVA